MIMMIQVAFIMMMEIDFRSKMVSFYQKRVFSKFIRYLIDQENDCEQAFE